MLIRPPHQEIADLLEAHGVARGSLLLVASGAPLANMSTLCTRYNCFKTGPHWEQLQHARLGSVPQWISTALAVLAPTGCVTREVAAAVEFWTATHATRFYGNFHSSFSVELAAEFQHLNKLQMFLNARCDDRDNCS